MIAKVTLPRPDVQVTTTNGKDRVVISRDGKAWTCDVEGVTTHDKIKHVVERSADIILYPKPDWRYSLVSVISG